MNKTSSAYPKRRSLLAKMGLASWRGRFAWCAGLLLISVLVCWLLARMTPSWYLPFDRDNLNVQDTASRAWNLLTWELSNTAEKVPQGEQRWSITQDEINSLLAVKASPPMLNGDQLLMNPVRNPVSDPFVVFGQGQVTLCARMIQLPSGESQGGVGSLTYSVGIVRDAGGQPMGLVKLTNVWAGYLPIPRSFVEARLRALVPSITEAVQQIVEFQTGVRENDKMTQMIQQIMQNIGAGKPFPLQYKIDNKEFIIKELTVDDGTFTIVLAPVKPPASPTRPTPATH